MATILFSMRFQGEHSKAGQPTLFVQKILNSVGQNVDENYKAWLIENNPHIHSDFVTDFYRHLQDNPTSENKIHTIRSGERWKKGDVFSPRVWFNKPYRSPQLKFLPDTEVKEVYPAVIDDLGVVWLNEKQLMYQDQEILLAQNDGLSHKDMQEWFLPSVLSNGGFSGQVISWCECNY